MRTFDCSSLVPGCQRTIRAETDAEVVMRAVSYYRSMLGDDAVRPSTVAEIKNRITDDETEPTKH